MNKLHPVVSVKPSPCSSVTFNGAREKMLGLAGLALLFPLSMMSSMGTSERLLSAVRYLFAA